VDAPLAYRLTIAVLAVLRAMLIYGEAGPAATWRPVPPRWRRDWAPFSRTPSEHSEVAPYISLH
jgi:hypothetical protein